MATKEDVDFTINKLKDFTIDINRECNIETKIQNLEEIVSRQRENLKRLNNKIKSLNRRIRSLKYSSSSDD